ncbi:MAG TPA: ATP-binding protein [Candidatus Binatia bacterium]|nr:ATP-binding protein [Candidatus Binatia bacterium]
MTGLLAALSAVTQPEFRDRLRWAVRVRWLVIAGFFALALIADGFGLFTSITPCVEAAAAGVLINGLNHWAVLRWRGVLPITLIALCNDLLQITYVTINTGDVQSPFVMMYVVQVSATAMLVNTGVAAVVACTAVVLFGAALAGKSFGLYPVGGLVTSATDPVPPALLYQGTWSAFLLYSLGLLVYLGGYISQRLSQSERDLAEQNRKLGETVDALAASNCELVAAYDRLKQAEAHLIQSEKMHALGQLVAGVAHELNNPISFVSANIEHLRLYVDRLTRLLDAYDAASLSTTDRVRIAELKTELRLREVLADLPGLLADCEEGAQRTKRIVIELRTFSRSDVYDRWRRIDIHQCIDSTLALLSHRLKNRVLVHRDFGELPEVECLPGQINQVLMNLFANAADAVGNAGNIWVTTRLATACDSSSRNGWEVVVSVRDDGVGIPPEIQSHIFDPFFTTKDVGKGTGLGLSVSYGIVQKHGGVLAVDSVPGTGATFTMRLPVERLEAS